MILCHRDNFVNLYRRYIRNCKACHLHCWLNENNFNFYIFYTQKSSSNNYLVHHVTTCGERTISRSGGRILKTNLFLMESNIKLANKNNEKPYRKITPTCLFTKRNEHISDYIRFHTLHVLKSKIFIPKLLVGSIYNDKMLGRLIYILAFLRKTILLIKT